MITAKRWKSSPARPGPSGTQWPPTGIEAIKLNEIDRDGGGGTVIDRPGTIDLEKEDTKTKQPPMYDVVIYNDDFTPAEFVVEVLQKFFSYDLQRGIALMITVHRSGKGVIGTYPKDVAETKVQQANSYATAHEHPLQLIAEKRD